MKVVLNGDSVCLVPVLDSHGVSAMQADACSELDGSTSALLGLLDSSGEAMRQAIELQGR